MIHIVVCRRNRSTMNRLTQAQARLGCRIKVHAYSAIFGRREMPVGTLIFTDFDHLHSYEIDAAYIAMRAVLDAAPDAKVLNRPERAMQRTALLSRLERLGMNDVSVMRVDTGDVPAAYPVFLRQEDGCAGPETALLQDEAAYRAARADLAARGHTVKGRIAVRFVAEPDEEGYFRKYGAFVVGQHIVPQHILRSSDWVVKSRKKEGDPSFIAEELAYIEENPHADALRRIAGAGGIDFGRIDYGFRDGKMVVFEINTNPTFPRFIGGTPEREARRGIIVHRLANAFRDIETEHPTRFVAFDDSHVTNSAFVERDSWLRHPHIALRQPDHWQRLFGRVDWDGILESGRWRRAIGRRWKNLMFRLSRHRGEPGSN